MEENMQAVGGILGNLKNMASDMGAEIEKQNTQLDRINDKVVLYLFYFIYKPYFVSVKTLHGWNSLYLLTKVGGFHILGKGEGGNY